MRHPRVALAMLVVGMFMSYIWHWVPEEFTAFAWNVSTSILVVYLLAQAGLVFSSTEVWTVVALLAAFKLMVIGCSTWYLFDPWPVEPGQALCSARLNMPLGSIGLGLGALLVASIAGEKR